MMKGLKLELSLVEFSIFRMKSKVLVFYRMAWFYVHLVWFGTVHAANYISELPGTTVIMKYNYTAEAVDWTGPNHENKGFVLKEKDMYGIMRNWNVTEYANNGHLNLNLPHAKRLQIVGEKKGQFYLQVNNVSLNDAGLYRCQIILKNKSVITETFIIQIKQFHELDITYEPFMLIKEGQSLNLCCYSNRTVINQTLRWFNQQRGMQELHMSSEACLYFKNLSRNDSGTYTCIAEYDGEIGTKNITISVSYSPDVTLLYKNYTETDKYRSIQCEANGYPRNYTYIQWEHKSFFDEHIRFLSGNATGYLNLPIQKRQFRYQDSGVYVCSVSNDVHDKSGQLFQNGRANVISKGTPVFVEDNKYQQYGNKGHFFDVKVNVFSFSNITCHHISPETDLRMQHIVMINRVNMWADFYGRSIKVLGWEVVFRFLKLNENDFKEYTIYVCNKFGKSSFTLQLLKEDNENNVTVSKPLIGIIISLTLLTCIVALMTKLIVGMRKRNANFTSEDGSDEPVEGQSEAIENVLYQSRQQGNHNNLEISPASTLLPNDTNSGHTISEHGTMTYNNEETRHSQDVLLNYADVVFQPSSSHDEVRIIGLENRTMYADVATSGFARRISDIQSDTSSSEDDFVYVQGIENYIEKRETND